MAYGRVTLIVVCLLVLAGMFSAGSAQAQVFEIFDTSWARQYTGPGNQNDVAIWLDVDADGNVYAGGFSRGDTTSVDYAIVKYDADGNELWVRRYDGPAHGVDSAAAFWLDADANVYVTGASSGIGTGYDYATIKYDTDGNLLWERRENAINFSDMAEDMAVDDAGNVYVTGHSRGLGSGQDFLTIKYDDAGTMLWMKRYNGFGVEQDTARCIAVDDSGNVYVSGTGPEVGQLDDIVTVKYDAAGTFKWVQRFNGSGGGVDWPNDMIIMPNGNICVTGATWSAAVRNDFVTLMYESDGTLTWSAVYNGTGNWYDAAEVVRADASGNVFVAGGSDSPFPYIDDIVTIKYDPSGAVLWDRRYSGPIPGDDAIPYDAQVLDDGSVWVGGYSDSSLVDFTALQYTSDGDLLQTRRFYSVSYTEDYAYGIHIDDDGYIYLTGATRPAGSRTDFSTVKFRPCWCPYQSDKDINGVINSVDLNALIKIAFFTAANLHDQGCPIERFDFDCNGQVDNVDFNLMVLYLFFNGAGPCQPCDLP